MLHIHHPNEVWHIQAALCALQHISLEDFPPLGPPAHLTCSSLHIPSRPTVISLFFWRYLAVRLTFDTLGVSTRYRDGCWHKANPCTSQNKLSYAQCHLKHQAAQLAWWRGSTGYVILHEKEPLSSGAASLKGSIITLTWSFSQAP